MSESVVVVCVTTRGHRRDFLDLPKRIHREYPQWVPRLRSLEAELTGIAKHPFWLDATGERFLAYRGGKAVGRIVALVNHAHNRRYEEKRGFFGFFESENDPSVSSALFRAARQWLIDQGMESMRGPCNPSLNYELGLLVDGFELPPTFLMTYNPPYYESLLVREGLEKIEDLFAFDADTSMLDRLPPKLLFTVEEVKRRFNVTARRLNTKDLDNDLKLFIDIYNRSLQGTWGFVPLSAAEAAALAKSLKLLLVPELTSIAMVDGKPIGVGWGMPDYNPAIKRAGGRLFPFGWWHVLRARRRMKRIRLISTNVLPEYQKWGLGIVTLERILPDALALGVTEAEYSWVLESNTLSRKTLERGGAVRTRTYRLYDAPLDRPDSGN
jgi:GNAT superfamily N-acetyltransferase